jgi:acyl-[acyl carrier protein]--UDP-N-acetylglucosamine O-acyltransferase
MFTGKLFQISDFAESASLSVGRDFGFAFAGKVGTTLSGRIVACSTKSHLEAALDHNGIAGVIVTPENEQLLPFGFCYALSDNPVAALNIIQRALAQNSSGQWETFSSRVHETVVVYPGAYIAPHDVLIEEGVTVFPNAVILPRSVIGKWSSIGPGVIVGTDAFEVDISSVPRRILAQSGGVKIGANVEIQANCTIVRATFGGFTELGDETKLDCQVHVAHDCKLGRKVRIAACAELSGRVTVGDDAFIAPNVSIANGVKIGEKAHVSIGSVVTRDVADGQKVTGNFAVEHSKWLSFVRSIR